MDQMELIKINNSSNENILQVQVTRQIAQRCRRDAAYSHSLFSQLYKKNLDGVTSIKIQPVPVSENVRTKYMLQDADSSTKKYWGPLEIKEFLKIYHKYKSTSNTSLDKHKWAMISSDLAKKNIKRSPERCREKWKNLLRSYKIAVNSKLTTKFLYVQEMSSILYNDKPNVETYSDTHTDNDEEEEDDDDSKEDYIGTKPPKREIWSKYEILKFLKIFQEYRRDNPEYTTNRNHWKIISRQLADEGVFKSAEKLHIKWKNLYRTYQTFNLKNRKIPVKFEYFDEIKNLLNGKELPEPVLDETSTKDNGTKYVSWTGEETLRLIELYKKHRSKFNETPKKAAWDVISTELLLEGIVKDSDKCENKWKNLVRSYRRNKTPNNNSRFYFYNEMKSIFEDNSWDQDLDESHQMILDSTDEDEEYEELMDEDVDFIESESDEGSKDDFEEIIIENEHNYSWSTDEIAALITSYGKFGLNKNITNIWERISKDLTLKKLEKSQEDCKNMWESLLAQYMINKEADTPDDFQFFKDIDKMLRKDKHHALCKCFEKKERDKERRHTERLELLKRKLDIEDRKVTAFEKYVKHLTESKDEEI